RDRAGRRVLCRRGLPPELLRPESQRGLLPHRDQPEGGKGAPEIRRQTQEAMNMLPTLRMPMLVVILLAGGLISCANSQSTAKHAKTAPAWFVDGQGDTIRTITRS